MNQFEAAVKNYWNYYLELESEFCETKRYVQFDERNGGTFSIEFLKLFQAICSEIDVVGKHLANMINSSFQTSDCKSIYQWWIEIQDSLLINENINDYCIFTQERKCLFDMEIKNYVVCKTYSPWKNFHVERYANRTGANRIKLSSGSRTPRWWKDYTDVKHHRAETSSEGVFNFMKASLNNVLESIAALYLMELAVLELSARDTDDCERFKNSSKLFQKDELASRSDIDRILYA